MRPSMTYLRRTLQPLMTSQDNFCPRCKTIITRWPRPRYKTLDPEEPQNPVLLSPNFKFLIRSIKSTHGHKPMAIRLFKHRAKEEMIMTVHPMGHTAPMPNLMAMTQFVQSSTRR